MRPLAGRDRESQCHMPQLSHEHGYEHHPRLPNSVNLIVFPPKADDNSCVFVYSIYEH